jgi:redox-regulated HSP33 family molecular chaperone
MAVVVVVMTDVVLGASIMTALAESLVAGVLLGTLLTGLLILTVQRERNAR